MANIKVRRAGQLTGHDMALYVVERGRSENTLFSAGSDNVIAEWDLDKMEGVNFAIRLESTVYSLLHVVEQNLLIVGNADGGIHLVDLAENKEVRHLKLHDKGVFDLKYHKGLNRFYAASADGSFSVWGIEEKNLLFHKTISNQKVRQLNFSQDEKLLSVTTGEGDTCIYETESVKEIYRFPGHKRSVNTVCFHPFKDILITGGKDAFLRFWDLQNDCKKVFEVAAHNFAIYELDFHPDKKWFATASRDKTIKIWDSNSLDLLKRLDSKTGGHINSVNHLKWLSHKNYLASTGDDRSVILWEVHE